jgi:glycosyltransferase involved in cell wall biosynthesis/SAM-dependent methyltransferase
MLSAGQITSSASGDGTLEALVSVVIPCYNQGHFLEDAIASVLRQTLRNVEVVVVDDGSSDDTACVTARFPTVRYIHQQNMGLAAARNTGLRASHGTYICFLDADDLLAPRALETGMRYLLAHPECAFVSGDHRRVGPDLRPLFKCRANPVTSDHYLAFLRGNYIGMHATVLYARCPLEEAGGFDETMQACEDYEMYLRISRNHPVLCHAEVVADYRQHDSNMSRDPKAMLRWALRALERELPNVRCCPTREQAYHEGVNNWRELYERKPLTPVKAAFRRYATPTQTITAIGSAVIRYAIGKAGTEERVRMLADSVAKLKNSARLLRAKWLNPKVDLGSFGRPTPLNVVEAAGVQEWYRRHFLDQYARDMAGIVLETSTAGQGINQIEDIAEEAYDCVACTDLHTVWDPDNAVESLRRVLKEGGVLLAVLPGVTVPGLPEVENDYWRFTVLSARRLLEAHFAPEDVETSFYGNVLAATGQIHRLPSDELTPQELLTRDVQHQTVVVARAVRRGGQNTP